jgi:uncharacterized protein (TIRG00374 family)
VKTRNHQTVFGILTVALVCGIAYHWRGSIQIQGFSWSRAGQAIAQTRGRLLLLSIGAIYFAYLLRALRWKQFSRSLGPTVLRDLYKALLMGFTAIFLFGRAAEPVLPFLLARKSRLPPSSMLGIYVIERIFDLCATGVLLGVGMWFLPGLASHSEAEHTLLARVRLVGLLLLLIVAILAAALIYFYLHGSKFIRTRIVRCGDQASWRRKALMRVGEFTEGLQAIRTFSDFWKVVFYSAAHWSLLAFVFLLVMRSFGGSLASFSLAAAMFALALTMIGSTLQLPGIGGGAQMATFAVLTRIFRIENEPAAAAAMVFWLITFASPCLAGIPLLIREGWCFSDLSSLAPHQSADAKPEESFSD